VEDNERRTILAIGLSLMVYMVWTAWFMPPPPIQGVLTIDDLPGGVAPEAAPASADAPVVPQAAAKPSLPKPPPVPDRRQMVQTEAWNAVFGSREGTFSEISLTDALSQPKVSPLYSWLMDKVSGEEESWEPYSGGGEPQGVLTSRGALVIAGAGAFIPEQGYTLAQTDTGFEAVSRGIGGIKITKTYRYTNDPRVMDIEVRFDNLSDRPIEKLWVGVADQVSGEGGRYANVSRPLALVDESVEHLDDTEDADEGVVRHDGPGDWFGIGDKYFMGVLIPEQTDGGQVVFAALGDKRYGAFRVESQALDIGASRTLSYQSYIGPKDLDKLGPLGHNLDMAVEFGWFGVFSKPLLWLLKSIQKVVGNWGVAIIFLTVFIKIVFFPLMQKQFVSSKRMQAIQPELKALKEKYKDNKELQTQATMKLFKDNQVNPMGGCLPMIVQMPVWFALYNVMLYSVELYNTKFLYLQDLTEADPYGVLPLLVTVLMLAQQKLMPMGSMDPAQQKIMRLMPLMFGIFMFSFPSGLVLYFSVNNTLTILQQWIIYRKKDELPVTASS
jgi:YidC/Oxa1 family membrane protein insertase